MPRKKISQMKQTSKSTPSRASLRIEVIIETPKGSRNKIKFEPSRQRFKLSKVMPQGMIFPFDFGFVPSTKAEDGDPLDVLVLTEEPIFPGCLVECTIVGAIEAEQKDKGHENRNDRLIAIAEQSLLYSEIKSLHELDPKLVDQIEAFFVNYQKLRRVEVTILGRAGPEKALQL